MSNFSCKTLDYVNPNDVGGGRESTERVFAAATRDQFQSRSRYVQEGWAATWMLSAQQSVERMVQGCQGNTQSQPGQTKSFPSSLWLSWSPTLHCLCRTLVSASPPRSFGRESSEHRDLLAGKPALGGLRGGVPVEERWRHRKGWWICVTTHKVHQSRVGRDLIAVSVRHSSM